ncbi:hypothetical protein PT974_07058 [Cladobotryum mycophilum]|uniref:Uncharacterized protein n=1 Tax=Cladobotryum mycophilum TaxID=491253 RepID=A0ABR0SN82_9HYPO
MRRRSSVPYLDESLSAESSEGFGALDFERQKPPRRPKSKPRSLQKVPPDPARAIRANVRGVRVVVSSMPLQMGLERMALGAEIVPHQLSQPRTIYCPRLSSWTSRTWRIRTLSFIHTHTLLNLIELKFGGSKRCLEEAYSRNDEHVTRQIAVRVVTSLYPLPTDKVKSESQCLSDELHTPPNSSVEISRHVYYVDTFNTWKPHGVELNVPQMYNIQLWCVFCRENR